MQPSDIVLGVECALPDSFQPYGSEGEEAGERSPLIIMESERPAYSRRVNKTDNI